MTAWFRPSDSLATRLGLYFSLGLAIVVAFGGLAVYWTFSAAVERELRDDLVDKVRQLRLSADALVLRPQEVQRLFFGSSDDDGIVRPLIRVTAPDGTVVIRSKGMQLLKRAPFPTPVPAKDAPLSVKSWQHESGRRFRLISAKVDSSPKLGRSFVVNLALDATREKRLLHRTRNGLFLGGLLGILAAFFLGRSLARRGLRPLREIGQAAILMSPEQLRSRLVSQGWSREISELASAFNSMLENLNDSFERLSHHSAVLSHELRTPLHHLRMRSDVVLSKRRSAPVYRRALEANLKEIGRLSQTVDSVLFLARSKDVRHGLKMERFDATDDLCELADFYRPMADLSGIRMTVLGSARLLADRELWRRAVSNLLSNALRHSPPDSKIELSAAESGGMFRLEVADQGPGIPEGARPHIFEPFYRVPGQIQGDGTGLGLAIVQRIVALHDGSVFVESAPGQGTRIGFLLPKG